MNKISFKELEKMFLEKYKNGYILKDNEISGRILVCYNINNGKEYSYRYENYLELAKRLYLIDEYIEYDKTFTILDRQIEFLKQRLYEVENDISKFYVGTKEEEIKKIKEQIKDMKVLLQRSIRLS